jgi:hypothetical protein
MALFAIPNPTKKITIDFSIVEIKKSISRIPKYTSEKYKITSTNDIFNSFTLEALEFLSLGVFIDINLTEISEKRTEVNIEIRRKVGAFDQAHEIRKANDHISTIIDHLSKLIGKTDSEFEEIIKNKPVEKSGCFIATAAMGDYNHPDVVELRNFRDNWLLKREWGKSFTKWYYQNGPIAAKVIEKSTILKKTTFYLVVKPLKYITKNLK